MTQPVEPKPAVNRVLGATAGPTDGNVRALIALMAMLFLHALFTVLLVAFIKGTAGDLKDFLLTMGTAILTLDTASVSWYYGRRAGEAG